MPWRHRLIQNSEPTPTRSRRLRRLTASRRSALILTILSMVALLGALSGPAFAQATSPLTATDSDSNPYEGRLVAEIRLQGLSRVSPQYVLNQLRTETGRPLEWAVVRQDLRRLERLGEFKDIQADILVDPDQNVIVLFRLVEAPVVRDVVVVGNRQVPDEDIRETVTGVNSLMAGIPVDEYQIGRSQRAIEELYRKKGYYQVQVTVDQSELDTNGVIIFRVREGERIKITSIRFQGNNSIPSRQLRPVITTQTAGILQKGAIDDAQLDGDVSEIANFYRDRGYLDVRTSRELQPSPNGREAILTFLIEEGPQYTLRSVSVRRAPGIDEPEGPPIFTDQQLAGLLPLKAGDVYTAKGATDAVTFVKDAYLKLGYVDATVGRDERRDLNSPQIDLTLIVVEGNRFRTGAVYIQGNELTQQKVVRREIDVAPDRWLDGAALKETERRLKRNGLFDSRGVKVTIQPEDPAAPGYRDVLVEVEETNTGSLGFGAAVSSDAGLIGAITLTQSNFDLYDTPDSFDEFISGRAFRGAGQTFNISVQPGTEESNYSIGLTEPSLFETAYSLSTAAFYRTREFDDYDEERYGSRVRFGRRFGQRWSGSLNVRAENIDVSDINKKAPVDIFEVEGTSFLTGLGFTLTRSTFDNRLLPTKGMAIEFGVEQVGALGGDYNFTKLSASHQVFFSISEDYLDRKTVLSFETRVAYIPQEDEAPIFERYFLGGRSFRGFSFRGIGPIGLRQDGTSSGDHVGGEWSFFFGTEVRKPIYKDLLSVVAFVDSGTLLNDPGFEEYRVSVGTGIRLSIPQLGPAPLAFDFAFPLIKQDGDDTQLFSFSIDIPFR